MRRLLHAASKNVVHTLNPYGLPRTRTVPRASTKEYWLAISDKLDITYFETQPIKRRGAGSNWRTAPQLELLQL